jgi:hypothetical protein
MGKDVATNGDDEHRAIPELSIDTQTIQKRLHTQHAGEDPLAPVRYEELSRLIGRNVQGAARHVLAAARKREERECGVVFAPVIGVGVKALDDVGVVGTGRASMDHIHRTARRGARRLTRVKAFDQLPPELRVQHNLHASVLAVIANRSGRPALKKLAAKIAPNGVLPLAKCLEAMRETL